MSEYEERKKQRQDVSLWLRVRGVPIPTYDKLSDYLKDVFHNCICEPIKPITTRQRGGLMRALFGSAGRDAIDPIDSAEEIGKLLAPLTEKEKRDYLSKF